MNTLFKSLNRHIFICLFFAGISLFTACEDYFKPQNIVVDLPEHQNLLVINSVLNPDSVIQVSVAQSADLLQKPINPFIETARVELYQSDQLIANLSHTTNGLYQTAGMTPEIGQTYSIRVSADGFQPVFATTEIPKTVVIDSMKIKSRVDPNRWRNQVDLTISFFDPADQENFYQLLLYEFHQRTDGTGWTWTQNFWTRDAVLQDRNNFEDETWHRNYALFDDSLFNGQAYHLKISARKASEAYTATFVVVLLSAAESYHRYFKTLVRQADTDGNPFAEPVQIFSNIEQGVGVFTAVSASKITIKL